MDTRDGGYRQRLGRLAEDLAVGFLLAQGATIVLRNYRCRCGELDIVVRHGGELAIIEVRARSSHAYGGAAESVNALKRRRIARAATQLLQQRCDLARMRVRFDVIAISEPLEPAPHIEWIRHAFFCAR